jgi:ATP-dependent helicase YprA (DUF1998 family)
VTFARYTGQESDEERQRIIDNPPDILLTNYVMLELILIRSTEQGLVRAAQDLGFLVFDELHTYRGRQGADVALLIRRVRELLAADDLRCVGTSTTIAGSGTYEEQRAEISDLATRARRGRRSKTIAPSPLQDAGYGRFLEGLPMWRMRTKDVRQRFWGPQRS